MLSFEKDVFHKKIDAINIIFEMKLISHLFQTFPTNTSDVTISPKQISFQ